MVEIGSYSNDSPFLDARVVVAAGSDLFDADWYRARYPDLPEGIDPVRHYLDFGAAEERDPGPGFSTGWYFAAYPDIAANDVNPLVHYVMHGHAEGRIIQAVAAIHSRHLRRDAQEIRDSGIFDAGWYLARYPDVAATGIDALAHYLGPGWLEGRDPSPTISTDAWLAARPGIVERRMHPMLRYIRELAEGADLRPSLRLMLGDLKLGMCRGDSPTAAAVAAFAALHRGLRVKARLKRLTGRATTLVADDIANHCLDLGDGFGTGRRICLVDGWWTTDRDVRLRFEVGNDGETGGDNRSMFLQAVQLRIGGGVVVQDLGHASTLSFLNIQVQALAPILLLATATSNEDGTADIEAAAVLPFPSLLRGGIHAAEVRGEPSAQTRWAVSHRRSVGARVRSVCIEGNRVIGSERFFRDAVRDWLAAVFGVEIVDPSVRTTGGALRLPPDAIPTVAALCARGEVSAGSALGVVVVAWSKPGNGWLLSMPPDAIGLSDLQPAAAMPLPRIDRMTTDVPIAIRFPVKARNRDAMVLTPHALDASGSPLRIPLVDLAASGGLMAVVDCRARADAEALVASLATQGKADAIEIVVLGLPDARTRASLAALFPDRHRTVAADDGWPFAALDGTRRAVLLFVDPAIRFHDPRAAATLATLALRDGVGTVGCVAITETIVGRGSRIAPVAAGLALDRVVALPRVGVAIGEGPVAPFVDATLPVVANPRRLFAIARDTLATLGGLAPTGADMAPEMALGVRAVEAGLHNLCTGAVTVSIDRADHDGHANTSFAPLIDLARALALRARVATVRAS